LKTKDEESKKDDNSTPIDVTAVVPYEPRSDPVVVMNDAMYPHRPAPRYPEIMSPETESSGDSSDDDSQDHLVVYVPPKGASAVTVRSAITHGLDPPSEHYLRLPPPPPQEPILALPPPIEESSQEHDHSVYHVETVASAQSVVPPGGAHDVYYASEPAHPNPIRTSNGATVVYGDNDNESVRHSAVKSSNGALVMYEDDAGHSHVGREPRGAYHFDSQSYAASQSIGHSHMIQEPQGTHYFDSDTMHDDQTHDGHSRYDVISHGTDGDWGDNSYATQPPFSAQSQTAHMKYFEEDSLHPPTARSGTNELITTSSRTNELAATGSRTNELALSSKKKKKKKKEKKSSRKNSASRHSEVVTASTPQDDNFYYGHSKSFVV
jgi:hypothetical protein